MAHLTNCQTERNIFTMTTPEQPHPHTDTDEGELPIPPDVLTTMLSLKQAAEEAGASPVQAAEVAITVTAQHYTAVKSNAS